MSATSSYNPYFQFIEKFLPGGFRDISNSDPLIQNIEKLTETNNQFFYIGDLIKVKILYSSSRSRQLMGVAPEDMDPSVFFTCTHPDDLRRLSVARIKLFNLGHDLFIEKRGYRLISSNFRLKHTSGDYINTLVQCYLFFSEIPYRTVFILQVSTDISWFKKNKQSYHLHVGDDLSFFSYPDQELLLKGNIFSAKEFEIIKLISTGMTSKQIAERTYRSVHTIDTHRRNILKKSGKLSTTELIYDLKERGMI